MIVDAIHCRQSDCAKSDTFVWISNKSLLFSHIGFVAARECLPQRISGSVSTVACMAHPRYPHCGGSFGFQEPIAEGAKNVDGPDFARLKMKLRVHRTHRIIFSLSSIPALVGGSLDVCAGQASIQQHVNFISMTQTHTHIHLRGTATVSDVDSETHRSKEKEREEETVWRHRL